MRLLPPLSLLLLVAIMVAATSSSMGSSGASNAYYAITSPAMLAAPEWPAAYRNYSLFVVFDSISPANLTIMRRDIPHASFLIYHAYASVVTSGGRCSGCTGASCSRADRPPPAFFERQWAITDLRTKQPMCLGGWWPPTQRRNPQGYIPMRASADGMLRYIKQELWEGRGFDGVYFDNLFTSFPSEFRKLIANTTDQFDSAQTHSTSAILCSTYIHIAHPSSLTHAPVPVARAAASDAALPARQSTATGSPTRLRS
eukprot:SAG31_NODE_2763_length_5128_cov_25.339232_3_plen_257_part_00